MNFANHTILAVARLRNRVVGVLVIALGFVAHSAIAQSFKRVAVQGGATLVQIASGGASVWALSSSGNPYIYQGTQFVKASGVTLSQIAVGGGSKAQGDAVWALDSAHNVYKANKSGTSWVFTKMPGSLSIIAVGLGYRDACHRYEIWGLDPALQIYRYNFCIKNWENIPGELRTLAVGNDSVWGIYGEDQLYRFDFGTFNFSRFYVGGIAVSKVTAGENGVWMLSCNKYGGCQPFQYNAGTQVFMEMKTGIHTNVTDIQAGGDGVWGLTSSGPQDGIFRLDSLDSLSFLDQVPGALASISVGSGGGVWGMDATGQVFAFSTP